jgi:hypothetical protein
VSEARARPAEANAIDALQAPDTAPLGSAITAFKAAHGTLRDAEDIIDAMRDAAGLILAAEAIKDAAGEIEATMRRKLAVVMVDTGAPSLRLEHHTISVTEPGLRLRVADPKALPASYLKARDPVPDMKAIEAAWAEGKRPAGVFQDNGGAPFVSIRARKE